MTKQILSGINVTSELQVNGSAGTLNYVLTSQGSGQPPTWAAASGGIAIQSTAPSSTSVLWADTSTVGVYPNLSNLGDVTITGAASNNLLSYNGTKWVNIASPTVTTLTANATTITGAATVGTTLGVTGLSTLTGGATLGSASTLTLGAGSSSVAPLKLTSGTNLSAAAAGSVEYDGTIATLTPNTSLGRAAIATPVFTSGAGTSGITANTSYALFPTANDTITLPVGLYQYQISIIVSVATSTVASTLYLNLRGSGNAVGTSSYDGTAITANASQPYQFLYQGTTLGNATIISGSSSVAGRTYIARGSGLIRVTTAGTLIPSYQFGATLTSGTVTFNADNYLIITPLASTNAVSTGAWS